MWKLTTEMAAMLEENYIANLETLRLRTSDLILTTSISTICHDIKRFWILGTDFVMCVI